MTVLIAKANQDIIEGYAKFNFKEASKNTCIFKIDKPTFIKLREWLREQGYNPYALMSW